MAVLEVCAAQGTGWLRRKMNLVRGKRVPGAPWRRRKCEGSAARLVGVALRSEFVTRGEFSRGSMTLLEKDRIAFCTFLLDSGISSLPTAIVGGNARKRTGASSAATVS